MTEPKQKWPLFTFVRAFFPLQLIVSHIKYNILSLLFWLILFLIVGDEIGYSFGVPLLFLSPEYLGEVNPWSFLLLGFSIGGFIMAFNTYSYIKLGPHYPFLTTLSKPFYKFCINNALIPIAFIVFLSVKMIQFQIYEELENILPTLLYLFALIAGIVVFFILSFFYFFRVAHKPEGPNDKEHTSKPITSVIHRREKWYDRFKKEKDRTSIYFGKSLRLISSRSQKHFNKDLVEKVFAKNKINASIFELSTVIIFFILGAFNNYRAFEVPAAASIVLLITIFMMLFSALHSWFKGWLYPLLIIVLLGMNQLSHYTGMFNYTSYAFGLNYSPSITEEYSIQKIRSIANNDEIKTQSYNDYIQTLENWKKNTKETKPKLIIVNTSGGGLRSALWTMIVMQNADQYLEGKLTSHTQLITGASGGMIGAAYYRELLLRKYKGEIASINDEKYRKYISDDLLNRLSFMASTNDIFIRYQKYHYNNHAYTKDRGFAFEQQLHDNTKNVLKHSLGYYKKYEQSGVIPTMIFTPTIVNDGRRMLISSQRMNFLTDNYGKPSKGTRANENIEYHSLLSNQTANDIRFSSVLRANATFPFVMPMVTLPTHPEMQLMDAGIRDNYGVKSMMEFLYIMENWIEENTSGVIVVQIRDTKNVLEDETYSQISFIDKITMPFGNMYKNFPRVQDFNQEELIKVGAESFNFPFDFVTFNLREKFNERISLSWHLTKQEKIRIENAFLSKHNQRALAQLKRKL